MKIIFKGKRINLPVKGVSFFGKVIGLMFHSRDIRSLLFQFYNKEPRVIHSIFVFFPFLALWLDRNNKVVDFTLVRPFCLSVRPKKHCTRLIEIPVNQNNLPIISLFVGKWKDLNIR